MIVYGISPFFIYVFFVLAFTRNLSRANLMIPARAYTVATICALLTAALVAPRDSRTSVGAYVFQSMTTGALLSGIGGVATAVLYAITGLPRILGGILEFTFAGFLAGLICGLITSRWVYAPEV